MRSSEMRLRENLLALYRMPRMMSGVWSRLLEVGDLLKPDRLP